jgi:hypothetical protein
MPAKAPVPVEALPCAHRFRGHGPLLQGPGPQRPAHPPGGYKAPAVCSAPPPVGVPACVRNRTDTGCRGRRESGLPHGMHTPGDLLVRNHRHRPPDRVAARPAVLHDAGWRHPPPVHRRRHADRAGVCGRSPDLRYHAASELQRSTGPDAFTVGRPPGNPSRRPASWGNAPCRPPPPTTNPASSPHRYPKCDAATAHCTATRRSRRRPLLDSRGMLRASTKPAAGESRGSSNSSTLRWLGYTGESRTAGVERLRDPRRIFPASTNPAAGALRGSSNSSTLRWFGDYNESWNADVERLLDPRGFISASTNPAAGELRGSSNSSTLRWLGYVDASWNAGVGLPHYRRGFREAARVPRIRRHRPPAPAVRTDSPRQLAPHGCQASARALWPPPWRRARSHLWQGAPAKAAMAHGPDR